jgi:catechol 2,3-dioxygenase
LTTPAGDAPRGFRLPSLRIGAVALRVADLERSVSWYGGLLGMREVDRRERDGRSALLLGAADGTPLLELIEHPGARRVPRRGLLGLYHFAVLLPDRAALGGILRHLVEHDIELGASDHLVSEALYLVDPDGITVEIYADRPRDTWPRYAAEIGMASNPLDFGGVVAEAAEEPWRAMPGGTIVGHMHFYVGDLTEAQRFYHEGLGLDRVNWSYPGAVFLSAGGYHHHVGINTWAAGSPPTTAADAGLAEWELVLADKETVRQAASSFESTGYRPVEEDDGFRIADVWTNVLRVRPESG